MKERLYQVYWRHTTNRDAHSGIVRAASADQAYDIVTAGLQPGYVVIAVYKVNKEF